jgi:chaperonin cofactor prefoldin
MADPEDRTPFEGVSADGRPRRQPPIIEGEAVEVSLDGSRPTNAGSGPGPNPSGAPRWPKRILAFLSPIRLAIIGAACIIVGIIAGALWLHLTPDRSDGAQRDASSPAPAASNAAIPDNVVERIAKLEAMLKPPPSQGSAPPYPPPLGARASRPLPPAVRNEAGETPALPAGEDRVGDLESRVAALDATLTSLTDRIASLELAIRDAATAARVAGDRAEKVANLFEGAKEGDDEQNRAQQQDRGALEDLASRVATLESQQNHLQQKQEGLDRLASAITAPDKAVRVATVAVALRSAVERSAPFTAELGAARSLGLDERALATLEPFAATGLPTRDELFHSLSSLLPELRRLSAPPNRDLGYLERLRASAIKMLNIRPAQDQPGDDPAAVVSRIEFKMAQQDVETMVAELDKLPAPARELAQPWRTKALARQDALESVQVLATASLAKLGETAERGPSPQ